MLGMARNAWGTARIGKVGKRVLRIKLIYILSKKRNDNKTERGTFEAINSPEKPKTRWKIQNKAHRISWGDAKRRNSRNLTREQQYKKK